MLVTFLVSLVVCLIVFIIIILNPSLSSDIIAIVNNLSLPDIVTMSTGPKKGPKIDTREDTNTATDAADASGSSTTTGVTLADSNSNNNDNNNDPPSAMSDKELNAILLSHIYTLTPLNATMHGKIKRQDVTRRDKT